MEDIRIEALDRRRLREAKRLVARVFPWQSFLERYSFYAIANPTPKFRLDRWLRALADLGDLLGFWGAIERPSGKLVGTTGLYTYTHDAAEAVWLSWFCVAPEVRRDGIGSRLLDFSINKAKDSGRKALRLYTSDYWREAAAQVLYESRGLREVSRKKRLFYTEIYRELLLTNVEEKRQNNYAL